MKINEFTGKWICAKEFLEVIPKDNFGRENPNAWNEPGSEIQNFHALFRKIFTIDKTENVTMKITADDYYKLYINGVFVTQGPAPNYYFNYFYNEIDISKYLVEGENIIAVHTYYQGLINRVWNSADNRQGMFAEILAGDKVIEKSDESWKYYVTKAFSGETIGYQTQYLENFDSNIFPYGWKELKFNDSSWLNSFVKNNVDYTFSKQPTRQLQIYDKLPKEIIKKSNNNYLIDYGQEIVGNTFIKIKGDKNQIINILHGEELQEDNQNVRSDMRCNCNYDENLTLSEGATVFENFDYKAFRYCQLISDKEFEIEEIKVIVRHYPLNNNDCTLKTNDETLDKIFEICRNGVKFCTQEGFLDCPTREKGQYLGDALIVANSQIWLSNDNKMMKKALMQFGSTTFICKGIMAVSPGSFMQEIADFSLMYPLILKKYYQATRDFEFLKQYYPIAKGIVDYFQKFENEKGLLKDVFEKWNLVDWPENLRDNYDFELTRPVKAGCHNVINAFYAGALKTIDDLKDYLEIEKDDKFEKTKKVFVETFLSKETGLFVDNPTSKHSSYHSNVYPLFFELCPKESEKPILDFLKSKGFSCGVSTTYFLFNALDRLGLHEEIYDYIVLEGKQTWTNMLKEGATTCYESWGKDQKWNTSLCHAWASAPISAIIEHIAGISLDVKGKVATVKPNIPEKLNYFELSIVVNDKRITVLKKDGTTTVNIK